MVGGINPPFPPVFSVLPRRLRGNRSLASSRAAGFRREAHNSTSLSPHHTISSSSCTSINLTPNDILVPHQPDSGPDIPFQNIGTYNPTTVERLIDSHLCRNLQAVPDKVLSIRSIHNSVLFGVTSPTRRTAKGRRTISTRHLLQARTIYSLVEDQPSQRLLTT